MGTNPQPSAAMVDSQSIRTTGVGGNERGFEPAKKVEGRKRHLNLWTPRDRCSTHTSGVGNLWERITSAASCSAA